MITKLLCSDFGVSVSTSGLAFATVSGLNEITYSEDSSDIDLTDFDGEGWGSTMPGTRKGTLTVAGFRLADSVTGVRDEGQYEIERSARQRGFASRRVYRLFWKTDPTQYLQFNGYAKNGEFGGGLDTATPWAATIGMDGVPTFSGAVWNV